LPATGRQTHSLVMNALVVALLGATLVVVKRRLTI
jgi:LPXTG-motif cell wall-anchored protein